MGEIVIPNFGPPQIEPDASDKLAARILGLGLGRVFDECSTLYALRFPGLASGLVKHQFVFKGREIQNPKVKQAFSVGAVISAQAYNLSGYDQPIDEDAFMMASMDAEIEGVPQVYASKAQEDLRLQSLVGIIAEAPELQDDLPQKQSYEKIVSLGAGLTRHYLHFAVLAA